MCPLWSRKRILRISADFEFKRPNFISQVKEHPVICFTGWDTVRPEMVYFCLLMITIVCPIDWGMILASWCSNKLQKGGPVPACHKEFMLHLPSIYVWHLMYNMRHLQHEYVEGTEGYGIFSVFKNYLHLLLNIWNGLSEFFKCMFSLWYNDEICINRQ